MICFYRTSFISHVHVILIMMLICVRVGGCIFAVFRAFLRGKLKKMAPSECFILTIQWEAVEKAKRLFFCDLL